MWYDTYDRFLEEYVGEKWDDETNEKDEDNIVEDNWVTDEEVEEIETRHLSPIQRFFYLHGKGR